MGETVVEKVARRHAIGLTASHLRPGDFVSIRPRHLLTHDNTAAVMNKFATLGASSLFDPRQPVFALDHDIQNRTTKNVAKYDAIEAFAQRHGIDFYPAGTGIGHQVMVEQGYVTPGAFVVGSDSHSNMYGALGAVGTPVVRTDAAAIWATGEFWWQIPRTIEVILDGELASGATGKDVIIALCGLYNRGEVLNAALEFSGPGIASLSMEARLTIANMTTEWGALVGWFPDDERTDAYLDDRATRGVARLGPPNLQEWRNKRTRPDADAHYAAEITLDLAAVTPHVAGPDSVQTMSSLAALAAERIAVDKAYIVSCVNSRQADLAAAADVLRGRQVAARVELYVAAASAEVQRDAEAAGDWGALIDAGARPLPAGCGPCIGLGTGLLEPGEVGISATNRNFKGRMGSRDARCYLASPAVVAASAAAGFITGPTDAVDVTPARYFVEHTAPLPHRAGAAEIVEGFVPSVAGRVLLVPADNLNTDGIYGKDYTYRDDMTRAEMAAVVMENYDPSFAARAEAGDILVGGANFGTGSSREQAVTALAAKGIALVVATSFSQTYLRNAYNNGFICIACPAFVTTLRRVEAADGDERRTIVAGDARVDFAEGAIVWREQRFAFSPLSPLAQQLVAAGGVENLVRLRLTASTEKTHG